MGVWLSSISLCILVRFECSGRLSAVLFGKRTIGGNKEAMVWVGRVGSFETCCSRLLELGGLGVGFVGGGVFSGFGGGGAIVFGGL